jgi:hypothetical protein
VKLFANAQYFASGICGAETSERAEKRLKPRNFMAADRAAKLAVVSRGVLLYKQRMYGFFVPRTVLCTDNRRWHVFARMA